MESVAIQKKIEVGLTTTVGTMGSGTSDWVSSEIPKSNGKKGVGIEKEEGAGLVVDA